MLDCFQAVQRSFRTDDLIYDFSSKESNAVGIIERGEASVIRIDKDGVSTVLEELIDKSYHLVLGGLSKKKQKEILEDKACYT